MSDTIAVFGEACTDIFVYGSCDRLCPEAPVPILLPHIIEQNDGMALNVANNIRSLGISCMTVTNDKKDIVKKRYVEGTVNQILLRVDTEERVDPIQIKNIPTSAFECRYGVISDYDKGFITTNTVKALSCKFSVTFLDTKKTLGEWAERVTFIKINEEEYNKTLHTLTDTLKDKLIVTLGRKGCLFRGKIYRPPTTINAINVCGAGDTFLAGLVVEYSKSNDIEQSINYALLCASDVVQSKGVTVPFTWRKSNE